MEGEVRGPETDPRISGIGTPAGRIDQRKTSRIGFCAPVLVRVLVEEESFRPMRYGGRTRNVSETGMLVEVDAMSEDDYKVLIRRQRMVRVHAKFPGVADELKFFGKIVCYDYHRGEKKGVCQLGMGFEDLPEREKTALTGLLERISGISTPPPRP